MAQPLRSARGVATQVLYRVAEGGAWAAPTLDAELRRAHLSDRDAALATAIVYGALRVLPELDAALDTHLDRPGGLDGWTRAAMRAAAYQIRHLPRVPARAAVHEAVALVKAKRGRLGALTNAVLRKLRRPADCAPPSRLAVPAWVADALRGSLGAARAEAFTAARTLPPPIDLRVETDRQALATELRAAGVNVEPGRLPTALHTWGGGDPRRWPGYVEGRFAVQEQGAQWVGALAEAQPGERVLDACAGRGGKTAQLARAVGPGGMVVAVDLHEARVEQIPGELERLGLGDVPLETHTIDWRVGAGGLPEGSFDRIVVDAPCSGLGTIHRRPEILLRVGPREVEALARLQAQILARVRPLLRPGGRLLYAVCSPLDAEGAEVARQVGLPLDPPAEPRPESDGGVRLGPWEDGCDGYQVFRWRDL